MIRETVDTQKPSSTPLPSADEYEILIFSFSRNALRLVPFFLIVQMRIQ